MSFVTKGILPFAADTPSFESMFEKYEPGAYAAAQRWAARNTPFDYATPVYTKNFAIHPAAAAFAAMLGSMFDLDKHCTLECVPASFTSMEEVSGHPDIFWKKFLANVLQSAGCPEVYVDDMMACLPGILTPALPQQNIVITLQSTMDRYRQRTAPLSSDNAKRLLQKLRKLFAPSFPLAAFEGTPDDEAIAARMQDLCEQQGIFLPEVSGALHDACSPDASTRAAQEAMWQFKHPESDIVRCKRLQPLDATSCAAYTSWRAAPDSDSGKDAASYLTSQGYELGDPTFRFCANVDGNDMYVDRAAYQKIKGGDDWETGYPRDAFSKIVTCLPKETFISMTPTKAPSDWSKQSLSFSTDNEHKHSRIDDAAIAKYIRDHRADGGMTPLDDEQARAVYLDKLRRSSHAFSDPDNPHATNRIKQVIDALRAKCKRGDADGEVASIINSLNYLED